MALDLRGTTLLQVYDMPTSVRYAWNVTGGELWP
jgi:hypothetical protein